MAEKNTFVEEVREGDSRREREIKAYQVRLDGRDKEAKDYVDKHKSDYGYGISTLGLIYNATGETLTLATSYDYHGHIYDSYPDVILNGQWGGFLHVKTTAAATGSEAVVVYRVENDTGDYSEILVAWDIPWSGSNHVYTEINDANTAYDYDKIQRNLEASSMANSALKSGLV